MSTVGVSFPTVVEIDVYETLVVLEWSPDAWPTDEQLASVRAALEAHFDGKAYASQQVTLDLSFFQDVTPDAVVDWVRANLDISTDLKVNDRRC